MAGSFSRLTTQFPRLLAALLSILTLRCPLRSLGSCIEACHRSSPSTIFTLFSPLRDHCHVTNPFFRFNRLKDSDVTWLYGPLHTAPSADPPEKISSAVDKLGVDVSTNLKTKQVPQRSPPPPFTRNKPRAGSSSYSKPILKKRSVTDILAAAIIPPRTPLHSSSPVYESVTAELAEEGEDNVTFESEPSTLPLVAGVLQASSRPPLWHTKSDSILARASMGVTLSTSPMSIQRLSPPGDSAIDKSTSLSPPEFGRSRNGRRSDSSSSYQVSDDSTTGRGTRPKRHISFNSFVEQRIVVDPVSTRLSTVYARSSSNSDSDEDEDDEDDEGNTILEMRSSSGSSLASTRRGSNNSQGSSSDNSSNRPQMTMITAPIAPTLLKEPDDLPAPSPAVVFVAPHGVDEEALKYEVHIASKPHFALSPDRKRMGEGEWSPGGTHWYQQDEMVDYFSGVPLNGEPVAPVEPPRESIYTDEDEDAITIRRRKGGLRSPRLPRREPLPPTAIATAAQSSPPETAHPVPRRSAFARRSQHAATVAGNSSSPPMVSHEEVARSGASKVSTISRPVGMPKRSGSSGDIQFGNGIGGGGGLASSNPRSSNLSSSMSSMRTGRSTTTSRQRAASASAFEGIDLTGHTSALSGRTGSESGSGLFSPPRESDLAETRGRAQRIAEEGERRGRGRSLLRTNSSSTISERERSSTTGSSSPMGSLSPRSTSSVGIVGGYIAAPTGIGAVMIPSGTTTAASSSSVRSSSGLRFESGSWSTEDESGIDGGDLAQVVAAKPKPPPSGGGSGLVRVSSSSKIAQTSTQTTSHSSGIRRINSSTNVVVPTNTTTSTSTKPVSTLQRTSSSSNIFSTTQIQQPAPSTTITTAIITDVPIVTLQPPSSLAFEEDDSVPGFASRSASVASHSPDSPGSFWRASELELESPSTPPSPAEKVETPGDDEEPSLHRDLSLAKQPAIKPRASGMSLASSTSNGSNESSATVVPKSSQATNRRSQLASESSSFSSSNASIITSSHRRTGSKSSIVVGPATPPMAIRSSSNPTRHVTQTVATRSEVDSPTQPASTRRHLRKLSGGMSTPADDKASTYPSPPVSVSPGSMLTHVAVSAKNFFDALWTSGDHSGNA